MKAYIASYCFVYPPPCGYFKVVKENPLTYEWVEMPKDSEEVVELACDNLRNEWYFQNTTITMSS